MSFLVFRSPEVGNGYEYDPYYGDDWPAWLKCSVFLVVLFLSWAILLGVFWLVLR